MTNEQMKLDAVFEGGGVKGIGLVGAVSVTEERGYQFENIAGTSAGAIIAALIAAGYKSHQLKKIIENLDYRRFKDKNLLDDIPLIGPALSLGFEKGIYEGDYFENWMRDLLLKAPDKPVRTFRDLRMESHDPKYCYKLRVIASDVSRGTMLVLPQDIRNYGKDPDDLDVAKAVRMSMSIPFFFKPVILRDKDQKDSYIVDGGVLSNFPVWLFDAETSNPPWPTIGYKLVEPDSGRPHPIRGPITLFTALFHTMMEAHDARYIKDADFVRTIPIPTLGVRTADFDISRDGCAALYESGRRAAEDFFLHWDFEKYKKTYRQSEPPRRRERV